MGRLRGGGSPSKLFKQAPLPFQGQKRRFAKRIRQQIQDVPAGVTFVDLFGGSGLVAHSIKHARPDCTVIWNDYDNYARRIDLIPLTNEIVGRLRQIVAGQSNKDKLTNPEAVHTMLAEYPQEMIDFQTLSQNLLFSGSYAATLEDLKKEGLWNRVVTTDYAADGYLDGIQRVRCDYRDLAGQFLGREDVVLVFDPPYPNTDASRYNGGTDWTLHDHVEVVHVLSQHPWWMYFTSERSAVHQILEACQEFFGWPNPLAGRQYSELIAVNSTVEVHNDVMLTNLPKPTANEDGQLYLCDDLVE